MQISRRGLVPVLQIGDRIITESLVISKFLDDLSENNKLTPPGKEREIEEISRIADDLGGRFYSCFYGGNP